MIVPSPLNKKYGTKVYNCDVILKKKDNGWGETGHSFDHRFHFCRNDMGK